MATVLLLVALLTLVLAIDTGRLFVEQRNLQRIADAAALETAQHHAGYQHDEGPATASAQRAAARNGYRGNLENEPGSVQLGYLEVEDGLRVFHGGDDEPVPEAVRVVARHGVPTSLILGGLFGQTTMLAAEAVAARSPVVGISAGTRLAGLDTNDAALLDALLGGVLGSDVELGVAGYQGLADASLSLLELAEGLALVDATTGVVTPDVLMDAELSLADLLEVVIADGAVRDALLGPDTGGAPLVLGDILRIAAGGSGSAVLDAHVNALDLIVAAAMAATGDHALVLDVADTEWLDQLLDSLPGVSGSSGLGVTLHVIEAPQIAVGPPGRDAEGDWHTRVETAQVRLQTDLDLELTVLGQSVAVDLGIALDAARGEARVETLRRLPQDRSIREVGVGAQPGIADLRLGRFADIEAPGEPAFEPGRVEIVLLGPGQGGLLGQGGGVGGGITLAADLGAEVPLAPGAPETLYFEIHDRSDLPSVAQSVSSGTGDALAHAVTGLEGDLSLALGEEADDLPPGLIGSITGALIGQVVEELLVGVLAPLLRETGDELLDPLIGLLGLHVGGMDVQLFELREGGVSMVQ